jgi:hypothetical protein
MKAWEVVIGIETHAQLSTQAKIFSGSSTAFGAEPNVQANAVDIALPGVLPVLNKGAVECAIRFGLAVGAEDRSTIGFRAQELLLPGPSQGLPDQPVRTAGGRWRPAGDHARDSTRKWSTSPAPTSKKTPASPCMNARGHLPRPLGNRPQPCRNAAAGDRHRAGHAFGGRSRRLRPRAARAGALDRHLRWQHAGGLVPLRRQRLGTPGRPGRSSVPAAKSRT